MVSDWLSFTERQKRRDQFNQFIPQTDYAFAWRRRRKPICHFDSSHPVKSLESKYRIFIINPTASSTPMLSLSLPSALPVPLQKLSFQNPISSSLSLSSSSSTMKKLGRSGTVHPSPPIKLDHLSFLPAAILTLATALSPDEREVLAYLIFCSNANTSFSISHGCRKTGQKFTGGKAGSDHLGLFNCDCFSCYTSFWARWDSSPNRHLIDEIIDAYENELAQNKGTRNNRKERRKKNNGSGKFKIAEIAPWKSELDSSEEACNGEYDEGEGSGCGRCDGEEESQKGSMRRLVSFIGEKVWGPWS